MVTGYDNIEHASLSDVGVRRSHNQDSHAVLLASDEEKWRERGHVFLVADGMGAHAVGELASELAVSIIPHTYHKHSQQGAPNALRKAFIEANASIHARGQANREFEGMGTTTTSLLLRPEGAWVGHVGDSRAYRVRDGHIEQLSFDHSLVWEYARRQNVDPEGVKGIPSNVIVRSLGPEPLVQVDVEGPHPLVNGDIYVLCSDGLSGQVTDPEIGAVASVLPPDEACRFLVDLANLRGGPDNITVVVIRIGGAATGEATTVTLPIFRRRWVPPIPWHLSALFVGVLLAGGAMALSVFQSPAGLQIPVFLLAAVAIIAGLIGLLTHYGREKKRAETEVEHAPPKVYRRSPCRIDRHLVDKLAKATQVLRAQTEEKGWLVDWSSFEEHNQQAETFLQMGDFPSSFREHCRSMRALAEAVQKQRDKQESFKPVYDKRGSSRTTSNGPTLVSYRCDRCGKVEQRTPGEPAPICCEQAMKRNG